MTKFAFQLMINFEEIKGITFDVYNTLMTHTKPHQNYLDWSNYLIKEGFEIYPQELAAARNYVFFVDMPKLGINSWIDWVTQIIVRLDQQVSIETIEGLANLLEGTEKDLILFDDVIGTMDYLSENYLLSVVTTIPEFMLSKILTPISDHLKVIVTGVNAGVAKGNPKMYQFDLNNKDIQPQNNIFIGDDPIYDIYYPSKMGQKTIEIARTGKFQSEIADARITSLVKLEDWL